MDDVGPVPGDRGGRAPAGEGDTDLGIAGEGEGGDADDGAGHPVAGFVARHGGGDDEGGVTAVDEVPGGLERAVGHAVHIGGKGLGDDDDTHTGVVAAPDVVTSTWIFPRGERAVSVASLTRAGQAASTHT
ncbi:hypothetical protein RKD28_006098 [Streptomyces sp. SAI-229]